MDLSLVLFHLEWSDVLPCKWSLHICKSVLVRLPAGLGILEHLFLLFLLPGLLIYVHVYLYLLSSSTQWMDGTH